MLACVIFGTNELKRMSRWISATPTCSSDGSWGVCALTTKVSVRTFNHPGEGSFRSEWFLNVNLHKSQTFLRPSPHANTQTRHAVSLTGVWVAIVPHLWCFHRSTKDIQTRHVVRGNSRLNACWGKKKTTKIRIQSTNRPFNPSVNDVCPQFSP